MGLHLPSAPARCLERSGCALDMLTAFAGIDATSTALNGFEQDGVTDAVLISTTNQIPTGELAAGATGFSLGWSSELAGYAGKRMGAPMVMIDIMYGLPLSKFKEEVRRNPDTDLVPYMQTLADVCRKQKKYGKNGALARCSHTCMLRIFSHSGEIYVGLSHRKFYVS